MSEDDIVQDITIDGADKAVDDFKRIGDAAEQGLGKIDAAAAKVSLSLTDVSTKIDDFGKKLGTVKTADGASQLKSIETAASSLGTGLRDVGTAVGSFATRLGVIAGAGVAAVGGIALLSKSLLETITKFDETGKSSRELRQEVKSNNAIFTEQQVKAVSNARAFGELNHQLVTGKVGLSDYILQFQELQRTQKNEAEDAIKVAIIQEEATKRRLEEVAALEKEQEKKKALNDLIKKFGADLTTSLLRLGNTTEDFWREFVSGPSIVARGVDAINEILDRAGSKFIEFYNRIAKAIASIFDIKENQNAAEELSKKFIKFGESVTTVIEKIIVPAFKTFFNILDVVAEHLSKALGFEITAEALVVLVIVAKLSGAFKVLTAVLGLARIAFGLLTISALPWIIIFGLVAAALYLLVTRVDWKKWSKAAVDAGNYIVDTYNGIKKWFSDFWDAIVDSAKTAWEWVKQKAAGAAQGAKDIWNDTLQFFEDLWNSIKTGFSDAWQWVKDRAEQFVNWLDSTWVGAFGRAIGKAIAWVSKLFAAQQQTNPDMSGGIPGVGGDGTPMASGGYIRGPGTGTSDSIGAWLSNGEFVMRAAAVQRYGVSWMHAINQMRMPKFNMGGLVDMLQQPMVPSFAGGGHVSQAGTGRPIILNIGGESFHLMSRDGETAENLGRFANKRRITSTGRKPSHWGA